METLRYGVLAFLAASCQVAGGLGIHHETPTAAAPPTAPIAGNASDQRLITMPNVMHQRHAEAEAAIRKAGMTGAIEIELLDHSARSTEVCLQTPAEGGRSLAHLSVLLRLCPPKPKPHEQPVLAGLSPAVATARAKAAGFTGAIEVHVLDDFDASCKPDTVCRVTPYRWEINQDPSMQLWVNKKMTISTP